MTYICHAKGCKYTTEHVMKTFTHEERKGGDHKMGLDFHKFLNDPDVIANVERLTKENYDIKKKAYLKKLLFVLSGCQFNGAGMRELLQDFQDEVCGS